MDERRLEDLLIRFKDKIPINAEVKAKFRRILVKKRRRARGAVWGMVGAAVALVIAGVWNVSGIGVQRVEAAALQVRHQVSFVEIGAGSPLGAAEFRGTVYVPVAGRGLYAYDNRGFHRLTDREVQDVKVSPDGTRLAWAAGGTVGLYDLRSRAWTEILKGDGQAVFYEQPSWKDAHTLLYVKKTVEPRETHGFVVKESGIYAIDLENRASQKLADGAFPSPVAGKNALVFEKDDPGGSQVVYKNLDGGGDTVLDRGRFPSVSPDGNYVAYVKTEQDHLDNVWIADADGRSKRAVTANSPVQNAREPQGRPEQSPSHAIAGQSLYSYYNPVWSSDSRSLYVLKNRNVEGSRMSLMRIDLSPETLGPEEVVRAFNQAIIRRDEDFARSLLKDRSTELALVSNPHRVSYAILGSGTDGGREYVDVEEDWAYTANPYYAVSRIRYILEKTERGYRIDEIRKLGGDVSVGEGPDGTVAVEREGGKQVLFAREDLPKELLPAGRYRIASLAFAEKPDVLLFALQVLDTPDKNQRAAVTLVRYDSKKKEFQRIGSIASLNGMGRIGVEDILVSPDGRFAAMDVFSEEESTMRSHVIVYDLKTGEKTLLDEQLSGTDVENVHTFFWDGDALDFTVTSNGQVLRYQWNAVEKKLGRP